MLEIFATLDPTITHLLSFLAGAFVGHRLAISRDKRKEINEVAQRLRAVLIKERGHLSPMAAGATEIDLDALRSHLHLWQRRRFDAAVQRYQQTKQAELAQDACGGALYRNPQAVSAAIGALMRFTKAR